METLFIRSFLIWDCVITGERWQKQENDKQHNFRLLCCVFSVCVWEMSEGLCIVADNRQINHKKTIISQLNKETQMTSVIYRAGRESVEKYFNLFWKTQRGQKQELNTKQRDDTARFYTDTKLQMSKQNNTTHRSDPTGLIQTRTLIWFCIFATLLLCGRRLSVMICVSSEGRVTANQ